jgi:drug/metabolite transporter (DMT)-like permease
MMMKSKTSSSSSSSSSSPYTSTQHLLLFFQILTTCSLSLLTQFTLKQNTSDPTNRKFAYNSLTVPFFAEFGKLALSLALFYWNDATKKTNFSMSDLDVSRGTLAMAAIPASLYAVSNNLNFFVIADLGAFSYQMLNQLKIVCTAIAFKVIMRKHLTKLQWRMMVLLTVGCMVSQLGAKEGGSAEQVRFAEDRHIFAGATNRRIVPAYPSAAALAGDRPSGTGDVSGGAYYANEDETTRRRMLLASSFSDYGRLTQGYVLESFAIVASSLAGVFVEMFLKNTKNPFYFQNALLYGWGTLITFASLVWDTNFFENGVHHELFRGHTLVSLLLVANSAFGGIATSAVMKYLDVIAKTFATTVSLFIVAFVSIAYLGETVRPELFLGAIVAAIAIEGYYHGPGLIDEDPNLVESVGGGGVGVELKSDFTLGEEDDEGGEMKTSKDAVV